MEQETAEERTREGSPERVIDGGKRDDRTPRGGETRKDTGIEGRKEEGCDTRGKRIRGI